MTQKRIKRYARRLDDRRLYKPAGIPQSRLQVVEITLDEFEAMRLVDRESMSQIDAAEDMQVSRATIQRLLSSGRKKLIDSILHQHAIEIKNDIQNIKLKGENKMNIAEKTEKIIAFPTSDKVTIDGHFGHTKEFAIYTVKDTDVVHLTHVTPPPHEPGVIPRFLAEQNIDVIITGGMGQMAVNLFNQHNIDVILGARGSIDVNLNEYLGGLLTSQGSSCDHQHGEGGHHGH
jgi:predicted DNA-binding protein (UPF0251 family)/predicted Fe-Mo cluster-binding NifX family protein